MLLIVSFSLRHGLSNVASEDLCSLINAILRGKCVPSSKYMLREIFNQSTFLLNFYCKQCDAFIVSKKSDVKLEGNFECEMCALPCNLGNHDNNFFVTFPIKKQLKVLLENTENVTDLLQHRFTRDVEPNVISDVYDGKMYADLCKENGFLSNRFNLSLTINTDGVKIQDGSKQLWPLFFRINEFPPRIRFKYSNCLLGGIWFADKKPNMHVFMSNFVRDVQRLHDFGFTWKDPRSGDDVTSKVIVLQCVADSKARPEVQNCKAHNGYYGCGYCYHPGVMFEGSNQAKYPMNQNLVLMVDYSHVYSVDGVNQQTKQEQVFQVEDREDDTTRQEMELAELNRNAIGKGDIKGITGKCVLMTLPYFNVVFSFPVDYMHACLLGVGKQLAELWFDSTFNKTMHYAGTEIEIVDRRLKKIRPPISISRRPNKMSNRNKWHANEWRNWILYYSLPCMQGLLPARYLKHHNLFVSAIYLLLQDRILLSDIERASRYLGHYCKEYGRLYGDNYMYFNVHLSLHLPKCVLLHGPLYCFSAFSFEGANGTLVNLVKGTRGVTSQIARKYLMCKSMPKIMEMYYINQTTLDYCQEILCYRYAKEMQEYNSVKILGNPIFLRLAPDELLTFRNSGHHVTSCSFQRMLIDNVMYHAGVYRRKGVKSETSVVRLQSGQFSKIERIIDPAHFRGSGEPQVLLMLRNINVLPRNQFVTHLSGARAEHIWKCSPVMYGDLSIVTADLIKEIAILIECTDDSKYISVYPNMYEQD